MAMTDAVWGFVGVVVGAILAAFLESRRKVVETTLDAWSAWASAVRIALYTAATCFQRAAVPISVEEALACAVRVKQEASLLEDAYRNLLRAEAAVLLIERQPAVRDAVSFFSRELYQPTVIKELHADVHSQRYRGSSMDMWMRIIGWFDGRLTEQLDRFLLERAQHKRFVSSL